MYIVSAEGSKSGNLQAILYRLRVGGGGHRLKKVPELVLEDTNGTVNAQCATTGTRHQQEHQIGAQLGKEGAHRGTSSTHIQ